MGNHVGGDNVGGDKVGRDKITYYSDSKPTPLPYQMPPRPHPYVPRPDVEQLLHAALCTTNEKPLVLLSGFSGSGKSTLAAQVVHNLAKNSFPDGIVWGSLDTFPPNEQLLEFLTALDNTWAHQAATAYRSLRDIFWALLNEKQLLVVVDHVSDARQLVELLPARAYRGRCKVLVISDRPLSSTLVEELCGVKIELTRFNEEQALQLFEAYYPSPEVVKLHRSRLIEIADLLDFQPYLLTIAAHEFINGRLSPVDVVQLFRAGEVQATLGRLEQIDRLSAVVQGLTEPQRDLFGFIGALGAGSWSEAMLSAVTLLPRDEVRARLGTLVERGLIQTDGLQRYRVNLLSRSLARRYFEQKDAFVRAAGLSLLARYCLDLSHDLAPSVRWVPPSERGVDQPLIDLVRAKLRLDLSHVQRVIMWAATQQHWDLLRRFAHVPPLDLVDRMYSNGFEIRLSLQMALIREPVFHPRGDYSYLRAERVILSSGLSVNSRVQTGTPVSWTDMATPVHITDTIREPNERCELNLIILAGQIIDGIFDDVALTDVQWAGVLTPSLTCKSVDLVGGQLLACDLSGSVLLHCDARRTTFRGSSLSYALLRHTLLRGADLRDVDLTAAVLEHVDLRGADLRGAVLHGATLEDVDLRGADLRGVMLEGVRLTRVQLLESQLSGVSWAGTVLEDVSVEEDLHEEIRRRTEEPSGPLPEYAGWRTTTLRALREPEEGQAVNCFQGDLRAANLQKLWLHKACFRAADLRGADLSHADLSDADLSDADLRAAKLSNAVLSHANLTDARLCAAVLEKADLSAAVLRNILARAAWMPNVDLRHGNLSNADLSDANLRSAQLDGANFCKAVLSRANLRGAQLEGTCFEDACCDEVDFSQTAITNQQLTAARQLGGALLPGDIQVALLAGEYTNVELDIPFLRFAHCSGSFEAIDLHGRDLFGARLDGVFGLGSLADANLQHAKLDGVFVGMKLSGADLQGARLRGGFSDCVFQDAIFAGADLNNANLVNCRFDQARLLDEAQLATAQRLRGCTLPDGTTYDGRYNCPGDREDAVRHGVDLNDPQAMALFMGLSRIQSEIG